MNAFETFVYEQVKDALDQIDGSVAEDIYALSFCIIDQKSRQPVLEVSYNTRSRAEACTPRAGQAPVWPIASDADEARWNYAFWHHEPLLSVGEPGPEARNLFVRLVEEAGLWFSDEEEESEFERCMELNGAITDLFIGSCTRVSSALHASGTLEARFGSAIPVIVHDLEYYEQVALDTEAANPPRLVEDFTRWVRNL